MRPHCEIVQEEALKEGEIEKRSDGFLQQWKKKRCVLTSDGLMLFPCDSGSASSGSIISVSHGDGVGHGNRRKAPKSLRFDAVKTLDCVDRKGRFVYFTIVTASNREIDFRCLEDTTWSAEITLALVGFKNRQALRDRDQKKMLAARVAVERGDDGGRINGRGRDGGGGVGGGDRGGGFGGRGGVGGGVWAEGAAVAGPVGGLYHAPQQQRHRSG
ncbi:pleckstrin homology-like domain family A member 2 isoform X2 [Petromyzon marinus]|uniref:Pleckstrin homology-like domain family A member 2 isoform X2 n=1 Tax=Petromyzon marinus TaxID=7757 RepID=A0AAJ7TBA3_PETMA|nr:pleckstrin homology-like domain family A member 2 isoform X2 [Petromyzon marinus]